MQQIKLTAQKRTVFGKKVKNLRSQGLVPANLFGKKIESLALSVAQSDLVTVYSQTGQTGMINLIVGDEKKEHPVLITALQKQPVTGQPLHADFRQVILSEKITAKIPVELVGEPPIVTQKEGVLIQPMSEIEVEALPMDLPEKFVVDVTVLAAVGDSILVSDIKYDKSIVRLVTDANQLIAKIDPLAAEEVVEVKPEEGVEAVSQEGEQAADQKAPEPTEGGEAKVEETPAT